jgi:hypothetical protein
MTLDLERVTRLAEKQEAAITRAAPALLERLPVEGYIERLARYPRCTSYRYTSRTVRAWCAAIRERGSESLLQDYHRLLLLRLIQRAPTRLERIELTDEVRGMFERNLERIVNAIESDSEPASYTYAEDRFRKQLGVCNLTLIPAGAQKIHLDTLPRTLLVKHPLGSARLVAELGGVQPIYQMHTDSNDPELMADFNPEGWARFYRRTAELLEIYPRVRGVFGSSWFFDPELESISPRLTYLRTLVTHNGGRLFRLGSSAQSTADATAKSQTRRRLVAEGRYSPISYLLIWPSRPLVEWARSGARP